MLAYIAFCDILALRYVNMCSLFLSTHDLVASKRLYTYRH